MDLLSLRNVAEGAPTTRASLPAWRLFSNRRHLIISSNWAITVCFMRRMKYFIDYIPILSIIVLFLRPGIASGALAAAAPPLPITGNRIVNVLSEPQLQAAIGNL